MKELSFDEVLRIAGGLPVTAALDEVTYRSPDEGAPDAVDYARMLGAEARPSDPS